MSEKLAPIDRAELGPFDSSEVDLPIGFLDFGALRLVSAPDLGIKLEVEESTGRVVALTLEIAESVLQVSVFAASKHEGIWSDVISQLTESIAASGGSATEYSGQLGRGINATVVQADGSSRVLRFVGVDGPRWFLRGTISGLAVVDAEAGEEVESVFRSLVVHRGDSPMPPREPLGIVVPAGIITPPRPGL